MTTNGEWLFSKPFDEQVAWMHEEHQERALDGDTDALERKSADLIHEYYKPMVSELQAQVDELKELNEYHALQYELASEDADRLQVQVDKLTAELKELVLDLYADLMEYGCTPNAHRANYKPRFEALGIEVDDDVRVR